MCIPVTAVPKNIAALGVAVERGRPLSAGIQAGIARRGSRDEHAQLGGRGDCGFSCSFPSSSMLPYESLL
eukprot:NODE_10413_length_307_cov_32.178571.p3 GENE.NODE_10413_length_307_cov_32.178571~~NODE_10413_length_307_cov_32.178571.p3  ORF type:complete len:70 (-),score=0.81 NODE_10413_length_307_cov_32.178571:72-281(-)